MSRRSQWRNVNCEWCGQAFRANRKDARFCSDACRKAAKRAETADDPGQEEAVSADGGPWWKPQIEAYLRVVERESGREVGWFDD